MTIQEANRINSIMKNVSNIQTLLGDLLMPINAMKQKYSCTTQDAVKIKLNAENYLQKYGTFTLDTTVKTISAITKNIEKQNDNKQQQTDTVNVTQKV